MATKETEKHHRFGRLRWVIGLLLLPFVALAGFIIACNLWVTASTDGRIYEDVENVPENEVGMVLGTSRNVGPNRPNLHFTNRMQAAASLYNTGRIRHILVSGANNSRYYNEARDMEQALHELGVPLEAITRDESGFRTLDSIVRAGEVFGQNRYTIITDDFHVSRAVFLARRNEQDVIGFAPDTRGYSASSQTRTREILARVKAVLDLYFFDTQPRELGEPQPIQMVDSHQTASPRSGKTVDSRL